MFSGVRWLYTPKANTAVETALHSHSSDAPKAWILCSGVIRFGQHATSAESDDFTLVVNPQGKSKASRALQIGLGLGDPES